MTKTYRLLLETREMANSPPPTKGQTRRYDGHASGIEKEYIPFHDILDIGDIMGPIIFCKAEAAGRE